MRIRLILATILAVTVAAGALHFAGAGSVLTFIVAGIALGGLAWAIGLGTESVGTHFGPAVTGVLQSTLGNLPELFVVLFALSAGETVVAQTSIIGSLFANALLVLGAVIVTGAAVGEGGRMRFGARLPNDTATLLLLAVFIIVLTGLSNQAGDKASHHEVAISVIGSICLLCVYVAWLWTYLRAPATEVPEESQASEIPFRVGIGILAAAGLGAALASDWFVAALDPAVRSLGISKAFTGLVVVAIAGNAVENIVGVTMAAKGRSELAISLVKNSVSQIAVFLFPALILLSLFFNPSLTFVLDPIWIGALTISALAVWQVTGDGEAGLFEGFALISLYIILGAVAFYE